MWFSQKYFGSQKLLMLPTNDLYHSRCKAHLFFNVHRIFYNATYKLRFWNYSYNETADRRTFLSMKLQRRYSSWIWRYTNNSPPWLIDLPAARRRNKFTYTVVRIGYIGTRQARRNNYQLNIGGR